MIVGVAIALGACLLFQVQFLLAKLILPWFGGAPAVWSTALVVFQALLLAGYAYAHALTRQTTRTRQLARHLAVLLLVVVVLAWRWITWPSPVTPDDAWRPDPDGSPGLQVVLLLTGAIGLPFLLLASTSPLLQRWYADRWPDRSPYRLYALSNLGSLIGLLSYPLVIEPRLDVVAQGHWWSVAFFVFVITVVACAWQMRAIAPRAATSAEVDDASADETGHGVWWLLLAAVPAALLQATTTKITQDIAAVPFLWMVPLGLYLVTFVVAFEFPRLYRRHIVAATFVVAAGATLHEWSTSVMLGLALTLLTAGSLALHGELAALAPRPARLTGYYLLVSAGGVLGSALVAFGAPALFAGLVEYPLTLMVAAALLAALYVRSSDTQHGWAARLQRVGGLIFLVLSGVLGGTAALEWQNVKTDALFTSRSFFGAIRVREIDHEGQQIRRLQHGTTLHGMQYVDGDERRQPTTYYTGTSGVGQVMSALQTLGREAHIGVVGLGTGTLAAYGREGDRFVFFEIDPTIVALSTAPTPIFTYLRDTPAQVSIVGGDARLSLEHTAPYGFDVLALDAFSSDAVPVHLLTREAFRLYARHLRDDRSILAVHVSNRYLRLEGVVRAGAADAGFSAVTVSQELEDERTDRSTWILLARDADALAPFGTPDPPEDDAPWTDVSSNLVRVLRR